jgi:nicotinamidase/pyrazinamidase
MNAQNTQTTHLLIIDPQEDFCNPTTGTLYVPGAEKDMQRLAAFVTEHGAEIDAIHVTLDSHHVRDIAHPIWWVGADGNHPAPFTIITESDVNTGIWRAARDEDQARSADYVRALAHNKRYPLCIWPYHCLIGSAGHAVVAELFAALVAWEKASGRSVNYITKGENPYTEHYSAIQADVIDPKDPHTERNVNLIATLRTAKTVYIVGEAGSHCVANTVRDLVTGWVREDCERLVLLTDAISPVPGFETLQTDFLTEMTQMGVKKASA